MEFNIVEKLLGLTLVGTAWVLWLLIALSVISVTIMIERAFFFVRMRIDFPTFSTALTKLLINEDYEAARKLCERSPALETQICLRAFEYKSRGVKAMRESMEGFLIGQKQTLDRGLMVLGTLGNNAPFIGLFGTVVGIMIAFKDLAASHAASSGQNPAAVMSGISEALVATAVGLMVAIPAVIAFNGFNRLVKRHIANAEAVMKLVLSHNSDV